MIPESTNATIAFDFGEVGKWHPWMDLFLEKLSIVGFAGVACREISEALNVDIKLHHIYPHKKACEKFATEWDITFRKAAGDIIEDRAAYRAAYGYEKPVFHKGLCIGSETVYSDKITLEALRVFKPERWSPPDDSGLSEAERIQSLINARSVIAEAFGSNGNRLN